MIGIWLTSKLRARVRHLEHTLKLREQELLVVAADAAIALERVQRAEERLHRLETLPGMHRQLVEVRDAEALVADKAAVNA